MNWLKFEYLFVTIVIVLSLFTLPFSLGFGEISIGILIGAVVAYFFARRDD
jgi:multisubunit Na+/H+ antiporter MnhE subunit